MYTYIVKSENPPKIYIHEIAAENKPGRIVEILTGINAQTFLDNLEAELTQETFLNLMAVNRIPGYF